MSFSFIYKVLQTAKPLFLITAFLCSSMAMSAQPGPDGNRGHLNRLLHNPAVIEHLGLTAGQAASAKRLSNETVEAHRADFERALAPDTKSERVPLVAKVFVSVNKETFGALKGVLSDAQLARLKQIEIQTFGIRSLARPATVRSLDMDPSQVDVIRDIANKAGSKLSNLHRSGNLSAAEKASRANAIQETAFANARQFLTQEQWVRWELLVGADFDRRTP